MEELVEPTFFGPMIGCWILLSESCFICTVFCEARKLLCKGFPVAKEWKLTLMVLKGNRIIVEEQKRASTMPRNPNAALLLTFTMFHEIWRATEI